MNGFLPKFIWWITGELVFVSLLLLTLNYFNILSFSQLYPQQFNWLPHISAAKINTAPLESGKELKCIPEKHLRIGNDLLQNYVVNQWRGGVEGILTAYDGNSITITKEGHSIKIPISKATSFYLEITDKNQLKEFKQIQINDQYINWDVRGSFFVIGKDKDWKDIIVGSDFTFYKSP